jgi:hypothetical protein
MPEVVAGLESFSKKSEMDYPGIRKAGATKKQSNSKYKNDP